MASSRKSTDNPREESIIEDPEEEPITEDLKRTLSLRPFRRTLKKTLSLKNLKRILSLWNLEKTLRGRFSRTLNVFPLQKTLIYFLVIVYDRVGDGDKHSFETFALGRPRFHASSHLKIEAKEFFMQFMNTIIATKALRIVMQFFFL